MPYAGRRRKSGSKKIDPNYNTDFPPLGDTPVREIRYEFIPVNEDGEDWIKPREIITTDLTQPMSWLRSEVTRQIKSNESCNASIGIEPFAFDLLSDGSLYTEISLPTTLRFCQKFDWTCCQWLQCHHCVKTTIEDFDHHTFGLKVSVHAHVDGPTALSLVPASDFDDRGYMSNPIQNFIVNVVGISTLNIGSKFILDTYRARLANVTARLEALQPISLSRISHERLAESVPPGQARRIVEGFRLNPTETHFVSTTAGSTVGGSYIGLQTAFDTVRLKPKTFCAAEKSYFNKIGAYLRSTVIGDTQHTLSPADSLWSISKASYGDGYYFLSLLRSNDIGFKDKDRLQIGKTITVPAMYKLWNGNNYLVETGDSLWAIAGNQLGSAARTSDLYKSNSKFLQAPDRIYPTQMLGTRQ